MKRTLDILSPAKMGVLRPVPGRSLIVSEEEADPKLSNGGHVCLIFIFIVLMVTYTVLTLTWHFTRPDEESFLQLPTSTLPPVNLKITVRCSNEPLCGDVTIVANYTDSSAVSATAPLNPSSSGQLLSCTGLTSVTIDQSAIAESAAVTLPLCFIQDTVINPQLTTALPIPGIQINFAGINPGVNTATTPHTKHANLTARGEVLIEAEDGSFSRLITMDSWQIKTLLVEQSVTLRDDVIQTTMSNPLAIQYEGGRPNWRSTLLIQQTAFANSYSSKKSGNLIQTIAGIGGAFYVILSIIGLLALAFGVCCPGPLAIRQKELKAAKLEEKRRNKKEKRALKEQQHNDPHASSNGVSPRAAQYSGATPVEGESSTPDEKNPWTL